MTEITFTELKKAAERGDLIPFDGHKVQGALIRKARHAVRDETGKFVPADGSTFTMKDGFVWTNGGMIHSTLRGGS